MSIFAVITLDHSGSVFSGPRSQKDKNSDKSLNQN